MAAAAAAAAARAAPQSDGDHLLKVLFLDVDGVLHAVDVQDEDAAATPLMLAALKGKAGAVEKLLSRGASVTKVDRRGATAEDYARGKGHGDVVLLLRRHAKPRGRRGAAAAPRAPLPPPRAAASASAVPPPPPPPPPSVTLLSVCFSILSYLIYLPWGSVVSSTHPPSLARAGARARASRRCSARIMAPPSHTSPSLCRSERISSRPVRLRLGA